MDLVAESDYEMDASDWAAQSLHDTMDEAYSDVMAVSESGGPNAPDVEFHEEPSSETHTTQSSASHPTIVSSASHPIIVSSPSVSSSEVNQALSETQAPSIPVAGSLVPHEGGIITSNASETSAHDVVAGSAGHMTYKQEETTLSAAAGEDDELIEDEDELLEDQSTPQAASSPDDGSEDLDSEEDRHDRDGEDAVHEASDEHGPEAVRITFNGQDFVIWSSSEIASYLRTKDPSADGTMDEQAGIEEIEAPALHVSEDVLWQPLDSFFVSLREKAALGDFLEEWSELVLTLSDLNFEVQEDNVYCRDITLDDLMQLHHGLGHTTSLHVSVSERPRFISKYNELAQHVAELLSSQLDKSGDAVDQEDQTTEQEVVVKQSESRISHEDAPSSQEPKQEGSVLAMPQGKDEAISASVNLTNDDAEAEIADREVPQVQQASGATRPGLPHSPSHNSVAEHGGDDKHLLTSDTSQTPRIDSTQWHGSDTDDNRAQIELDGDLDTARQQADSAERQADGHEQAGDLDRLYDGQDAAEVASEENGENGAFAVSPQKLQEYEASEGEEQFGASEDGEGGEEDELQEDVDPTQVHYVPQVMYAVDDATEETGYEEHEYEDEEADADEEGTHYDDQDTADSADVQLIEVVQVPAFEEESADKEEEEEQILEYIDEVEDNHQTAIKEIRADSILAHQPVSTRKRTLSEEDAQNGIVALADGESKRIRVDDLDR